MAVLRITRVRLRGGSDDINSLDHRISPEKPRAGNSFAGNWDLMVYNYLVQFSLWRFKESGEMPHSHLPLSPDSAAAFQFPAFTEDVN